VAPSQGTRNPNLVGECKPKWLYLKGLEQREYDHNEQKALEYFEQAQKEAGLADPQVEKVICRTSMHLGNMMKKEAEASNDTQVKEQKLNSAIGCYKNLKAICF
jgi:hypothetical protein